MYRHAGGESGADAESPAVVGTDMEDDTAPRCPLEVWNHEKSFHMEKEVSNCCKRRVTFDLQEIYCVMIRVFIDRKESVYHCCERRND